MMLNKRQYKMKIPIWVLLIMLGAGLVACSKMDSTYEEFIRDGERIYIGRADSVTVQSGFKRIQLSWLAISDPKVSGATVYWNNRTLSKEVEIKKTQGVDSLKLLLTEMPEGDYAFEIVTHDKNGNFSMPVSVIGKVYGDQYISSLSNRTIEEVVLEKQQLKIVWGKPEASLVSGQLKYTDLTGIVHDMHVPADQNITVLDNYKSDVGFEYQDLYRPDVASIDIIPTAVKKVKLRLNENIQLDRNRFKAYPLPLDAPAWTGATGNLLSNLWSGILVGATTDRAWYRTANGSGIPHHFQLDLGRTVQLTSLKMWQRGTISETTLLFANGNLRNFEIWGSENPSPTGSYEGWTKLVECKAVKPSGLPVGQVSQKDIEYAQAGEGYTFPASAVKARYVRIKVLETWAKTDYMFLSEITFRGSYLGVAE